jgi:hypothetical protein
MSKLNTDQLELATSHQENLYKSIITSNPDVDQTWLLNAYLNSNLYREMLNVETYTFIKLPKILYQQLVSELGEFKLKDTLDTVSLSWLMSYSLYLSYLIDRNLVDYLNDLPVTAWHLFGQHYLDYSLKGILNRIINYHNIYLNGDLPPIKTYSYGEFKTLQQLELELEYIQKLDRPCLIIN